MELSQDTYGKRLRRARAAAGLTQAELAKRLGVKQSHIARFEIDGRRPSLESAERIASALGYADVTLKTPPATALDTPPPADGD